MSQEHDNGQSKLVSSQKDSKTLLTELTEAEEKENLDYLNRMKDETGVEPIWLKKQ
jgi:hypothetical protein